MRLLIKFAKGFKHQDMEKDVDSHQTVDNLSVIISLTISEFNRYDLYYHNTKLNSLNARLGDFIDKNELDHQIKVVKKSVSVIMMDQARAFKDKITINIKFDCTRGAGYKLFPVVIAILLLIIAFKFLG